MKLIFTLGNAEKQYDHTRHNVGFWVADTLAEAYGVAWKEKAKFKCHLAEAQQGSEKVLIAKHIGKIRRLINIRRNVKIGFSVGLFRINVTELPERT